MSALTKAYIRIRESKGQTMAEYGLILALIAVVAGAAYGILGGQIATLAGTVGGSL